MLSPYVDKPSVHFSEEREMEFADCRPLEDRFDHAASHNRLSHSENRLVGKQRTIAQSEEVQFVQRNRLCVEVEDSVRMCETLRFIGVFPFFRCLPRLGSGDVDRASCWMR